MRLAVDPARHSADDDRARRGGLGREEACRRTAVPGTRAGSDDRDGGSLEEVGRRVTAQPQARWGIRDLREE